MEGDAETAHKQFAESIALAKDLGSLRAVADCLDGFGYVAVIAENTKKRRNFSARQMPYANRSVLKFKPPTAFSAIIL